MQGRARVEGVTEANAVTDVGAATEERTVEWLGAMRWRRRVKSVVAELGLTFTQWFVLRGAEQLNELHEDPIQNEIAAWLELDRKTTSQVLITLQNKQLVDRDINSELTGWCVEVTPAGTAILRAVNAQIEAVSAACAYSPGASVRVPRARKLWLDPQGQPYLRPR